MPTIRDKLLPVVDRLRALPARFGLRRYSVVIRRRTWPSGTPGLGTPLDDNTTLTPPPKVRPMSQKEVAESGGTYQDGDFELTRITPRYTAPTTGGYSPAALRLVAAPGEDVTFVLTGDEGAFECELVNEGFNRAFGYTLTLRQKRGPVRG